jgi:hypothetical protein
MRLYLRNKSGAAQMLASNLAGLAGSRCSKQQRRGRRLAVQPSQIAGAIAFMWAGSLACGVRCVGATTATAVEPLAYPSSSEPVHACAARCWLLYVGVPTHACMPPTTACLLS